MNSVSIEDEKVLKFIKKERRDRVRFELQKDRLSVIHKFQDVHKYFDVTKSENFARKTADEIIETLKKQGIPLNSVYVMSYGSYDGESLKLTPQIFDEIMNWTPAVLVFSENAIIVIGELEYGPTDKYLILK